MPGHVTQVPYPQELPERGPDDRGDPPARSTEWPQPARAAKPGAGSSKTASAGAKRGVRQPARGRPRASAAAVAIVTSFVSHPAARHRPDITVDSGTQVTNGAFSALLLRMHVHVASRSSAFHKYEIRGRDELAAGGPDAG